jgi:hypothetical protein
MRRNTKSNRGRKNRNLKRGGTNKKHSLKRNRKQRGGIPRFLDKLPFFGKSPKPGPLPPDAEKAPPSRQWRGPTFPYDEEEAKKRLALEEHRRGVDDRILLPDEPPSVPPSKRMDRAVYDTLRTEPHR